VGDESVKNGSKVGTLSFARRNHVLEDEKSEDRLGRCFSRTVESDMDLKSTPHNTNWRFGQTTPASGTKNLEFFLLQSY